MVLRYLRSFISGNDTGHKANDDSNDKFDFDITNEEVQQLLQTDDELLEDLESQVEDDLAHLVYEGETESHYAVLEIWWYRIARNLGHEAPDPDEDDSGAYVVTLVSTSAYQEHSDRVGEYPEVEFDMGGTSPFVVEH